MVPSIAGGNVEHRYSRALIIRPQMIAGVVFFLIGQNQDHLSVVVGHIIAIASEPITPFLNISPLCLYVVSQRGWITPISDDGVRNRRLPALHNIYQPLLHMD